MIIDESTRIITEKNRGVTKNNILQTIKNREMDRKDFLKYSGFAVASLVGLKAIISLLAQPENQKVTIAESRKDNSRGFGGGKYGV